MRVLANTPYCSLALGELRLENYIEKSEIKQENFYVMSDYNTRQTLIERLQLNQDERSWGDFEQAYSRYIYVIVRNMGLPHHDAEDVRQQVLLRAWKGLAKLGKPGVARLGLAKHGQTSFGKAYICKYILFSFNI